MSLKYKHVLLFVDDEKSILNSLHRLFRKTSYEIYTATSGPEGLDLLKNKGKVFSMIISDQRMPEMLGAEFLEKSKDIFPQAIRILLTGYSDMDAIVDAVNKGQIHRYLSKPWNDTDLLLQVKNHLEQYELVLENRRLLALTKKQNKDLATSHHDLQLKMVENSNLLDLTTKQNKDLELRIEENRDLLALTMEQKSDLEKFNEKLEKKVTDRTRQLAETNEELAFLNKELEESLYNTIRGFSSILEMHNPMLSGHGRRVSFLARDMAQLLNLSKEDVNNIEMAGLLHDIGKLGFPEHLMQYDKKNWNLKDRAKYQNHSQEGQSTIQFIEKLDAVGLLIRGHHEQYNGEGFPDKLAADEIPLGAKIISIADTYDNIINKRIYTPKLVKDMIKTSRTSKIDMPEDDILRKAAILQLKQESATIYDPELVSTFVEHINNKNLSYGKEKEISLNELAAGMVLTKSIYSSSGLFLLPHNVKVESSNIFLLQEINKKDPIIDSIFVRGK